MNAVVDGDVPFIEGARLLFGGQQVGGDAEDAAGISEGALGSGGGEDADGRRVRFRLGAAGGGAAYCDAASRDELKNYFAPKVDKFVGAPRALDQTIEGIDLCIANKAAQAASVAGFLGKY